jgi:hypothetical protein
MPWRVGDRLKGPYLGEGVIKKIAPQEIEVSCGDAVIRFLSSQRAMESLGWVPILSQHGS